MRKMKIVGTALLLITMAGCNENKNSTTATEPAAAGTEATATAGQSAVKDDVSQKNVVQVAIGSPDHTTLVAAVQAAGLVDVLSNAGPFTVFAPTNEAFKKLPAGTVENLLKPENKEALVNILQYHVAVAVYKTDALQDGQVLGMVNGDNATITIKDGKTMIGNATILASVPASNGIVHVIDGVILPPPAK